MQLPLFKKSLKLPSLALTMWLVSTSSWAADACSSVLVDTKPKRIANGFQYTEGPAWDPRNARFVFSDIPANTIYSITRDGKFSALVKPSGYANGNAFDSVGNLWSARHDRTIGMTREGSNAAVAIDTFNGKKLNSPNDLAISKDGSIWFTDPPFGIQGYGPVKADEEQAVRGVYRLKDGQISLQSGELKLPNGLAFSPNGRLLYVADTADGFVYRFNVTANNQLTDKKAFAKLDSPIGKDPMVDGIRVDSKGNLWMTGLESLGVFSAAGDLLCKVSLPGKHVSNFAFGGADGRDLLITFSDEVLLLRTRIPGF